MVIRNQRSLRLGYHWRSLFEREYLSLVWIGTKESRLCLLRLHRVQTGLWLRAIWCADAGRGEDMERGKKERETEQSTQDVVISEFYIKGLICSWSKKHWSFFLSSNISIFVVFFTSRAHCLGQRRISWAFKLLCYTATCWAQRRHAAHSTEKPQQPKCLLHLII